MSITIKRVTHLRELEGIRKLQEENLKKIYHLGMLN
jgi:hypothetical protein